MNLKKLPPEEKPRERLLKYGKNNVSNNELIEIILKSGTKRAGIKEISHNILSSVNIFSLIRSCGSASSLVKAFLQNPWSILFCTQIVQTACTTGYVATRLMYRLICNLPELNIRIFNPKLIHINYT